MMKEDKKGFVPSLSATFGKSTYCCLINSSFTWLALVVTSPKSTLIDEFIDGG